MDVIGQNVVNANTAGYSRQRVDLKEVGAAPGTSLFTGRGADIGGGTRAAVTRIRGVFVEGGRAAAGGRATGGNAQTDAPGAAQQGSAAAGGRQTAITAQTDALSAVQTAFAEPGDTGLQATMDSFYSAWHDLANNPDPASNTASGSVVIQRGLAVTDQLHALTSAINGE